MEWLGVSYGLTLPLFNFWRRQQFLPVYLRLTPNDITGEHTCIMLRVWLSSHFFFAPISNTRREPRVLVVCSVWPSYFTVCLCRVANRCDLVRVSSELFDSFARLCLLSRTAPPSPVAPFSPPIGSMSFMPIFVVVLSHSSLSTSLHSQPPLLFLSCFPVCRHLPHLPHPRLLRRPLCPNQLRPPAHSR